MISVRLDIKIRNFINLRIRRISRLHRLDIHSDTRAYPPLSNHLLSPVLPTPLTVTSLGPHPSGSASDVRRMSALRVTCGSQPLITLDSIAQSMHSQAQHCTVHAQSMCSHAKSVHSQCTAKHSHWTQCLGGTKEYLLFSVAVWKVS